MKWYKFVDGKVFPCENINDAMASFATDRRIDLTEIDENCHVSTVFLGVDHGFNSEVPILFETMIFGGDYDGQMYRYSTFGEAKRGHWSIVEVLRKNEKPEGGLNFKKMLDEFFQQNHEDDGDWWKNE